MEARIHTRRLCNKFSSCFDIRIRIRSFGAVTLGELVTRECVVGFVGKPQHKFEICAQDEEEAVSFDFDEFRRRTVGLLQTREMREMVVR